jgi:hypothetical protein
MRIIYNKSTNEIVSVIEDDNSITSFPPTMGVLQGDDEFIKITATALGLDLSLINSLNITPEEKKLYKDKNFGKKLVDKFVLENMEVDIDEVETLNIFTNFGTLKGLLESGAIGAAKNFLEISTTSEMFNLTPNYQTPGERRQFYLDEITNYLNS